MPSAAVRFRTLALSIAESEALLSDLYSLDIRATEFRLFGEDHEEWRGCVVLREDEQAQVEQVIATLRAHDKIESRTVEPGTYP